LQMKWTRNILLAPLAATVLSRRSDTPRRVRTGQDHRAITKAVRAGGSNPQVTVSLILYNNFVLWPVVDAEYGIKQKCT